jgi:hypothetical protein
MFLPPMMRRELVVLDELAHVGQARGFEVADHLRDLLARDGYLLATDEQIKRAWLYQRSS